MFGGFGNNQNTNFGNTAPNPGFGSSPFASNTPANTNTTTGFGFGQPGQQQNPAFGSSNFNPQGFGSTSFNQTTPSTFNTGATTFPSGQSAGFGGSTFGGFGQQQQQPPSNTFQSSNTFGMTNTPTSGFGMGSTNITSTTINQGTGNPTYAPTQDKESGAILSSMSIFHSISAMPAYKNWSFEELRFADYGLNKKYSGVAAGGGFGNTAFGSTLQAPTAFGSTNAPSAFGTNAPTAFGAANPPQTNAFGGMNTTGGFGFGASSTPAFSAQPQVTQAASVFGAPSTTPAFGATAGGFGQPQGATAFGQKPAGYTAWGAQTTGSGFGTSSAFGAQPVAAAPTSSWGAPAASSGFGIQTAPAAGAFGQPAQPAGGLFGAKPATVGFSFAPTTTAPTASTGMFGAASSAPMFGTTQQQAAPSGGLFNGAAKSGFSFGTGVSTSAPFGTLASTASNAPSLFGTAPTLGQPAAAGGGLFGAPAVTTQPTAGLFGTPAASFSQPSGLFGTSAAPKLGGFGSFQSTTPQAGMAGMGTIGGGMFGQASGSTNNMGAPSLFGGMTPGAVRPQGPTLTATIDRNPFGVNPLFTPSKAATEPSNIGSDPLVLSVQNAEKKKPILTPHFKVTPRSTSKIKLRGFAGTSPVAGPGLLEPKSALKIQPTIVKEQKQVGLDSRFTPRKTMTKLIISEAPEPSITSVSSQKKTLKSGSKEVTFDPSLEEVALYSIKEKEIVLPASQDVSRSELSTPSKSGYNSTSALTSPLVHAKSSDYMIDPPISDLLLLSDDELHAVSGFKVSLEGVGWVKFLRPVDLLQASPTGTRSGIIQIPGSVIILEPKICTVYPDENVKPPCGFGLNVPAEINIEKCWPLDKSTKKPVLDESDPRHDRHMQKLERMPGTKWLGFHNPTGTWRFKVEHFSRYGLIDEDSDEEIDDRLVPQEQEINNQHNAIVEISGVDEEDESIAKDSFAYIKDRKVLLMNDSSFEGDDQISQHDYSERESENSEEDEDFILIDTLSEDYESEDKRDVDESEEQMEDCFESVPPKKNLAVNKQDPTPSFPQINIANSIQQRDMARKVQTMKSSLFSASRESVKTAASTGNSLFGSTPLKFDLIDSKNVEISSEHSKREKTDFSPERGEFYSRKDFELSKNNDSVLSSPKKYRRSFPSNDCKTLPVLSQSVLIGNEKQIADASLFMSRSFRAGWGGKVLIRRSSLGYSKLEIIPIEQLSGVSTISQPQVLSLKQVQAETVVSFISIISEDSEEEEELMGENDNFFVNINKIPKASLSNRLNFSQMEAVTSNEEVFHIMDQSLWKLASALWDDINIPFHSGEMNEDEVSGIIASLRKEKFSAWLRWAINSKSSEILKEKSCNEKIWHYLVSRRIDLAITEALAGKNFRLASLLTQINGPSTAISTKHPRSGLLSDHIYFGGEGTDYGVVEDISAQMKIWQRNAMNYMDASLSGVWKLLSGNIELWDTAIFKSLTDWRQFFGLYFWYGHGGHLSIHDVAELYISLYSNNGQIPEPIADHSKEASQKETDICFNLIKLFVDDSFPLEQALKPLSFSSKSLDCLSPWIIYIILAKVKNIRDFRDAKAIFTEHKIIDNPNEELSGYPVISSVSSKGDMLTSNVINQLEIIGLWQWAIFVSLFLTDHFQRSFIIKRLLGRYYPIQDNSGSAFNNSSGIVSSTWEFLVIQLKVPTNWIHESRALQARNICQPIQESVSLLDANLYDSCHTVVISKVAPVSLFSANHSFLFSILTALDSLPINNWESGGDMILNYLKIITHVPSLIKKAELSQINASVADRSENILAIEELKDIWIDRIRSIVMLIGNIRLQRDSIWHKSDICNKSLNFISEKVDCLLIDSLQVIGAGENLKIDGGSGLSFVISESKEWFSSILSV